MKQIVLILTVYLITLIRECLCKTNQCPDVFKFYKDGTINYGLITIPPPGQGRTILEIEIGIRDHHNGDPSSLLLVKSLEDAVADAERGWDIQYIYRFPQSRELPTIRRITLNHRDICTGYKESNVYTFWNKHEIINPEGATQLSHIPYRQPTTPKPIYRPPPDRPPTSYPYYEYPWFPNYPPPIYVPGPSSPPRTYSQRPRPTTQPPPTPRTYSPRPRPTTAAPPPPRTNSPRPRPTTSSTTQPPPSPRTSPPRPAPARSPMNQQSDTSWLESMPFAGTCGRRPESESALQATQLIIGGDEIAPGEFPWLVALFHYKGRVVENVCGATLITSKYVISAAHCTRGQKRVYLELGKHDISDPFEEDYIARSSMNIIEHTEYVVGGAHGDVSLIEIERVKFSQKVHPICLWAQGTRLDNEVQEGTVTGWGRVQNDGPSSKTPMKLNVRMAGLDKCREADRLFKDLATDKTFCAGGAGTGPCHGDSGGGFYMKYEGVWYLRGVISTSLGSEVACNVERYAVYVDLIYFLDWMRQYLLS